MLIRSGGKNKAQWTFILIIKHSRYPKECPGLCTTSFGLKASAIKKVKTLGSAYTPGGLNSVLGAHWKGIERRDEEAELEGPEERAS